MANGGWYGTQEEWDRLEKPLLEIDSTLTNFAKEHDLVISCNLKDWPERSIKWGNGVRCLIQIYLVSEELLTFNMWLCISEDRGNNRYWKQELPIKEKTVSEFKEVLPHCLIESYRKLQEWSQNTNELEFATKLE